MSRSRSFLLASLAGHLLVGTASGAARFQDDFSDPSSGWPHAAATHSRDAGFAVYANGKYQLTPVKDHAFGLIAAPRQAEGGDVRLRSRFFLYAGLGNGGGGLACRIQDQHTFYAFIVVGSGEWRIAEARPGKVNVLAEGRVGNQVMAGAVDADMTAECAGDRLTLSLDGRQVGSVRHSQLQGGQSGVFVAGTEAAGTSVSFDDFALEGLERAAD